MAITTVIGLGTMGQGIAVAAATAGHPVRVFDQPDRLDDCLAALHTRLERHAEGAVPEVVGVPDLAEAVRGAEVVIEAVPEDIALKHTLFRELNELLEPTAILATNTSSLPLDQLAEPVAAPERFLAAHFFNPAELVPGVEVARVDATTQDSVDRLVAFLRSIGKEPIVVGARAGFVANRLQLALFLEALACVEDGTATAAEVDAVVRRTIGFRLPAYGPFTVADMAGLDVYHAILTVLRSEYGERFAIPDRLARLVDAGHIGLKTGSGFRDYSPDQAAELVATRDATYRRLADATS